MLMEIVIYGGTHSIILGEKLIILQKVEIKIGDQGRYKHENIFRCEKTQEATRRFKGCKT